jgi:hypothetical protein
MSFPKMRRAVVLAATGLAISAARAHAEPPAREETAPPQQDPELPRPEPPARALREEPLLHLALEVGGDTPLGNLGIALEVHPFHRLILAGGIGGHEGDVLDFQAAISARYRLITLGNASLAAGLGFSRGDRPLQREGYAIMVVRSRVNAIRLNPELSLDYRLGFRWTIRAFAGLGVILTHPSACQWFGGYPQGGSCSGPMPVPPPYDQVHTPVLPYAGLGIAANTEKERPGVGSTWYGWQLLISDVAAATMLGKGSDSSTVGTDKHALFYGGLALWTLGGPTLHIVHQRSVPRALISVAMRVVPPLVALALAPSLSQGGHDFLPLFATMGAVAVADWTVLSWSGPSERHGS